MLPTPHEPGEHCMSLSMLARDLVPRLSAQGPSQLLEWSMAGVSYLDCSAQLGHFGRENYPVE